MSEVETLKDQIRELKGQIEELQEKEINEEAAKAVYGMHDSYIKAGFSEEQAFELTKMGFNEAMELNRQYGGKIPQAMRRR